MSKSRLEERLERLRQLRGGIPDEAAAALVRKSLHDRANLIVAEAANAIAHAGLKDLIPELLSAYGRLFENAARTDPKCWGKTAIISALTSMEYTDSPPFIRGLHHVQMEPVWGGQEDAAFQLRSACVLALPACTDLTRIEIFRLLVDAMLDGCDPVRMEGVRVIEQMNGHEAGLLLRLKAGLGDQRSAVSGQVFDSLLALERDTAVEFVARYLNSEAADVRDEAALSLGGSRLVPAVAILIDAWNVSTDHGFRNTLLRALSSSRQPAAIEFLLGIVRSGLTRDMLSAIDALKLNETSPEINAAVEKAKQDRLEINGR
jgi:hypothetical protein